MDALTVLWSFATVGDFEAAVDAVVSAMVLSFAFEGECGRTPLTSCLSTDLLDFLSTSSATALGALKTAGVREVLEESGDEVFEEDELEGAAAFEEEGEGVVTEAEFDFESAFFEAEMPRLSRICFICTLEGSKEVFGEEVEERVEERGREVTAAFLRGDNPRVGEL